MDASHFINYIMYNKFLYSITVQNLFFYKFLFKHRNISWPMCVCVCVTEVAHATTAGVEPDCRVVSCVDRPSHWRSPPTLSTECTVLYIPSDTKPTVRGRSMILITLAVSCAVAIQYFVLSTTVRTSCRQHQSAPVDSSLSVRATLIFNAVQYPRIRTVAIQSATPP